MKDYYAVKKISNSSLGWFLESPKYFKAMLDGELEQEEKSYFLRGQKIHMYLLENSEFWKHYVMKDIEKPRTAQEEAFCLDYTKSKGKTDGERAKEAYEKNYAVTNQKPETIAKAGIDKARKLRSYIKHLELNDNREIIKRSEFDYYENICNAVKEHKLAKDLIFPDTDPLMGNDVEVFTEHHVEWEWDKEFNGVNLPCKGLIDRFLIDHKLKKITLVDLKTTSNLYSFSDSSFQKFSYGRQLAYYWKGLDKWISERVDAQQLSEYERETYVVAVSVDTKLQEVEVFKIHDQLINTKQSEIDVIMERLSWHWVNNLWDHRKEYYETPGFIEISEP